MSEQGAMYGYQDDEVPVGSGLSFGLNAGNVRLVKFEWTNQAGKGGSELEALDIQFMIDGGDRPIYYRQFPITKAFDNNVEITDPTHEAFKKAVREFNSTITHVMHAFIPKDVLQSALATPITSFKEFCKLLSSLLPKDYTEIPLDLFVQYQWQIKENAKKTYLEIPKKMSYGKWLCKTVQPVGSWHKQQKENPDQNDPAALRYVDDAGNIHPFVKNGWFMNSNFANQQSLEVKAESGGYQPSDNTAPPEGWKADVPNENKPDTSKEDQVGEWNNLANK